MANGINIATTRAADLLSAKATYAGIPTLVTMQVTDRCNYSCSHCYQEHKDDDEMSTIEIFDYLEQLAEMGILFISFMGGEFFMRRDADDILRKAHELGFAIKVLSTGHHITEKRADFLATLRPLHIDMSLYGSNAKVHEAVTLHQGSWERTYKAAKRLVERKITVLFKSPVMESNVDDLIALEKLAHELGAQYTFDPKVTAIENGDTSTVALRMSQESLTRFYKETMAEFIAEKLGGTHDQEKRPLTHTPCRAGQVSCYINPRGEVWPCGSLPVPVGDLRKQSFRSIWERSESLDEIRNLRWATISECNVCPVRDYCNRCHGMALIEHGKMNGPSLEACRHAVMIRDSLRDQGLIPDTARQMPPTWGRVDLDGQHANTLPNSPGKRSSKLRVLG